MAKITITTDQGEVVETILEEGVGDEADDYNTWLPAHDDSTGWQLLARDLQRIVAVARKKDLDDKS